MMKFALTAAAATAIAITPLKPAKADSGDVIAGAIVGGTIVGIIANEKAKERKRQQVSRSNVYVEPAPQRQVVRGLAQLDRIDHDDGPVPASRGERQRT